MHNEAPVEEYVAPMRANVQELVHAVFDSRAGRELLDHWLATAGLSRYLPCKNSEEFIRKDERQRFVLSIMHSLALTPEMIRASIQARMQANVNASQNHR